MKKLIKLSSNHYIVVDDSEIKEGDFVYSRYLGAVYKKNNFHVSVTDEKKIIHSTQPIEYIDFKDIVTETVYKKKGWAEIKQIFLSEVEEALLGYNFEEIAEKYINNNYPDYLNPKEKSAAIEDVIWGFKKHQELSKDKLFIVEDVVEICFKLFNHTPSGSLTKWERRHYKDFIQSIQPTEWDIEFINSKIKLL